MQLQTSGSTTESPEYLALCRRLNRLSFYVLGIILLSSSYLFTARRETITVIPISTATKTRTAESMPLLETQRVVLVDEEGARRLGMAVEDGIVRLDLFDATQTSRATLALDASGHPRLALRDAEGLRRATLALTASGNPRISFRDANGTRRASLGSNKDTPYLRFYSWDDKVRLSAFLREGGEPEFHLFDVLGRKRLELGLRADGTPKIQTIGTSKEVVWSAPNK